MTKLNILAIIIFIGLLIAVALQGMQGISDYNKRFNYLTSRIRCETCPNTAIKDSDGSAASAIKADIASMLSQDFSNNQILDNIKDRHSEQMVYDPGVKIKTKLIVLSLSMLSLVIIFAIKFLY
jgi:cytochrome c-type biogenesis protein CcmH/NrfF